MRIIKRLLFLIVTVIYLLFLVSCEAVDILTSSNLVGNEISSMMATEYETNSDRDTSDKNSTSSMPPEDTHIHPTLLKGGTIYILVGQGCFVETTDFCKQLDDIKYTIRHHDSAGIGFVYDKDTNEPKQSSSGVYIVGIEKGVYEINVHGIDKNGRGYDDSLDIRVLNESDLVATSSNIFSDDGQSSSISSGVTTSNYSPTLFKYSGSTVLKVYEEKFIEFSSFTKNAKEVKCYLAPTSNMTNGVIYDAENAELVQEKNGCHIKGLKQGRVFLCVEVTEESGEKHKGIILVIILNEM